ncbi:MAG: DEAD/DEAH box helicase [Rhizobiales bacterium]|nr:DEAD/DEAH box helicase [Hyphomicrobiales bacterium]
MTTFSDLGLAAPLLKALDAEGYTAPTPIQAAAIPSLLAGEDLLGIAQTGTGKTAAFALPILQRLAASPRPAPRKGCRVLVLAPTRELASQIAEGFRTYGRHYRFTVATVFGGVGFAPQIRAFSSGTDIIVATPGRLLDHMASGHANLKATEILVLDEADQMLDLGFVKPIRQIVASLPSARQTLLFSATMPAEIADLARAFLKDPLRVEVAPAATTAERVAQRVIHLPRSEKRLRLVSLLSDRAMARTLVFTRTKRGADRVAGHLEAAAIGAAAIHGNKSQRQREAALEAFRSGRIRVLVATDIAARGIDVDGVTHVVNFELPEVAEAYVHRIGRTARAGASGEAISLCEPEERDLLRAIERLTRQRIPSEDAMASAGASGAAPADDDRESGRERPRKSGGSRRDGPARSARPASDRRDDRQPARRPDGEARRRDGKAKAGARSPLEGQHPQAKSGADRGDTARPSSAPEGGRPRRRRSGNRPAEGRSERGGEGHSRPAERASAPLADAAGQLSRLAFLSPAPVRGTL